MGRKRIPNSKPSVDTNGDVELTPSAWGILETAPDAMIVTDQSGKVLFANRMTQSVFGYSRAELVGQSVDILLPVRLRTIHSEHRRKFCERPSTRRMGDVPPLFGLRKEGGEFPAAIWLSPLLLRGQLNSIVVAVRDMTEQRRIETSLRRAERMASLGILTAGIAHEINGPIGAALLTAEVALTSDVFDDPNGRLAASFGNIASAMERCGKTVHNILKFARNEPGEQIECDLNDRVWHVNELLRPYATEHLATINFTSRAKTLPIHASPLEIEILIGNLVRNAIESRETGAAVELKTDATESLVELTVSDNGAGMPESQITQIFDPFFTTRQNNGGTGLGLSIVYRIAQHHRASIDVQSIPGTGTSVRVHFPRVDSAQSSPFISDSDSPSELHKEP